LLANKLANDPNLYKLRRMGNDDFPSYLQIHQEKDADSQSL
jgi:hypothetical protein